MAPRHFGAIRTLPSGRWQARYRGPDGVMRPAPGTFERKGDASRWLAGIETDIAKGEWRDPDRAQQLVTESATGNAFAAKVPGTTIRDLMGRMGHDLTRAAMIYLHGAPGADRIIANALPVEFDRLEGERSRYAGRKRAESAARPAIQARGARPHCSGCPVRRRCSRARRTPSGRNCSLRRVRPGGPGRGPDCRWGRSGGRTVARGATPEMSPWHVGGTRAPERRCREHANEV